MKSMFKNLVLCVVLILSASNAFAQTSAFTYQGKLTDGGTAANGQYDLTFKLYASGGAQIGSDIAADDVQVTAGIFTVNLDFGSLPFTSDTARLLEIAVRPGASTGAYTTLSPRQPITSAPFAIKTVNATSADSLSAACVLVLCVTNGHITSIDGAKVTGAVNYANLAGNVAGVVGIENGGTGSSTKNFVDLSTNQRRIEGNKEFLGDISVANDGRFAGNGSGLTNLNGGNLTNGSVTAAKLAPDALVSPPSNSSLLATLRWDLLRSQTTFPVGSCPSAIAFDGTNIWTANYCNGTVSKLRASDGANLGTFSVDGQATSAIAFDGANIWTANYFNDSVTKLRASDGACIGTCTFPAGTGPRGIAFDGVNIWVANITSNNVTKLRASDGANQGTFAVGTNPVAVAFDGTSIWVANQNSNSIIKMEPGGGINATIPLSGQPSAVVFDGTNIWVAMLNGNVTKLRNDATVLGTFPSGFTPYAIAFDGTNIWVANDGFANVTKLRASDGFKLGTFHVGTNPRGIAFDGTSMWTANSGLNSVTRLPPAFP